MKVLFQIDKELIISILSRPDPKPFKGSFHWCKLALHQAENIPIYIFSAHIKQFLFTWVQAKSVPVKFPCVHLCAPIIFREQWFFVQTTSRAICCMQINIYLLPLFLFWGLPGHQQPLVQPPSLRKPRSNITKKCLIWKKLAQLMTGTCSARFHL